MTSKEIGDTNSAGQILVFHSPLSGSSCTTSLANVAWNIASTGRSVLLVDFNLHSPSCASTSPRCSDSAADAPRGWST
ncbi:hypothetical protein KGD82_17780 [Nocardiopsis eucommiae]|uniref:Uncharacterized protein n=1 Tax=Nocardiopsis eucommiae TaxID=2831970 RepID=A0A975QJU6_9ACTN|nr:hypothetical protein KGD82_17780 [Nocardiopsis eucommiae]